MRLREQLREKEGIVADLQRQVRDLEGNLAEKDRQLELQENLTRKKKKLSTYWKNKYKNEFGKQKKRVEALENSDVKQALSMALARAEDAESTLEETSRRCEALETRCKALELEAEKSEKERSESVGPGRRVNGRVPVF